MLKLRIITCHEVAKIASQYIDNETTGIMPLKIRLHLMMCTNCTRFVKHLKLTRDVARKLITPTNDTTSDNQAADILANLKQQAERN